VRTGKGRIKLDAKGSFFRPKIPMAIMCINTRENIVVLCTIGQNLPPVSYFGEYMFRSCVKYKNTNNNMLVQ
jgi:hypothetical protein